MDRFSIVLILLFDPRLDRALLEWKMSNTKYQTRKSKNIWNYFDRIWRENELEINYLELNCNEENGIRNGPIYRFSCVCSNSRIFLHKLI